MRRALALAMLAAACGDDPQPPPPPLEADVGGLHVVVESRPARIEVRAADGTVLLDGVPGGAAVRHGNATFEMVQGAWKIEEDDAEPWTVVSELDGARLEGGAIRFTMRGDGGAELGEGTIAAGAGGGEITIALTAAQAAHDRVSLAFACDAAEHFLGFGGQSFDVDHRGQTVPLWVQEDGIGKHWEDFYDVGVWFLTGRRHSTHTPIPMYLSSRGYALLAETSYRSIFAMCSEDPAVVRVEAWEPALRLRLFHAPTPVEVLEKYTAHVGRPELPPAFAFAPWLDAIFGSDNVRRVAQKLRDEDVPASVIWTEDWRGGAWGGTGYALAEAWRVDRTLYPDFEAVADDLHAGGYKFLTYNNTFVMESSDIYQEAVDGGHVIEAAGGGPYLFESYKFEPSSLVDLTDPAAWEWTKAVWREGLEQGADGWMADFAEWMPHDAVLASGEVATGYHNLYPVDYQRLNKQLLDEQEAVDGVERLFFARSGFTGSQPLVSVFWAGDQQTDFSEGDGMPSVIPMGIGLGVAGFPYFAHDIAGYMSEFTVPSTKELFFRWTTLGALSPVMRTHHGRSADVNWSWETDAETIAHVRRWAKLHQQLHPYLMAMAMEASERGTPMFRPLALAYPAFPSVSTCVRQRPPLELLSRARLADPHGDPREETAGPASPRSQTRRHAAR